MGTFTIEKTGKGPCAASKMAFVCPWPCVAEEIHPKPKKPVHTTAVSFAQALCGSVTTYNR